jgi:hypothetical protein
MQHCQFRLTFSFAADLIYKLSRDYLTFLMRAAARQLINFLERFYLPCDAQADPHSRQVLRNVLSFSSGRLPL